MRHRLLIAGATLGVVTLSVGLVVSGLPSAPTPVPPATLAMSAPAVLARGVATVEPTSVDAVIVSFRHTPADPAKAARLAVRGPAHAIAGASVLSARTLRSDTAEVRLSSYVSRTQAARIASAAQRASQSVRYAEPSIRFYPTDAGSSDYYWNLTQVKATTAWTTTRGSADVVVGVIDTGIADNPLLPKALLLSTVDQKVSGRTISGTTWPGLTVTLNYTSGGASQTAVTAVAGDRGNWSATLPKVADDGSTLSASVTDASKASTTTTEAVVNSSTHLTVVTPSIGSTLSGTVDADATVKLTYPDNTTQSATVSGTAWSVTPSATLADGDTVTVTATDSLGNTDTKTITVDRAISLEVDPSNGTVITGATDAGATVTLTTPAGSIDCSSTVTADSDGRFSCTPTAAITDATVVTVTAVDPLGNTTTATVTIDASPHLVVNSPSNGKILSGTADADATVTVTYPDDSTQTTTRDGVAWSVTPDTELADDSTVTVSAVDSLGNTDTKTITIDRSVKLKVDPSNGTSISGTTDAKATVTFADAEGHQLCATKTADVDGKFSCTPDDQLADDTAVVVTTTDPLGNAATVTLTVNASTNLTVNPSNGTAISGSVDTDATVTISDGDTELCTDGITVAADGTFSCKPATALSDGTVVTVTARDSLDNVDKRTVTVDATAPTLTVNPSNGSSVAGKTEAGAQVDVSDSDGTLCAELTADQDGAFTCTISPQLADGTTVTVTASDAAGNQVSAQTVVDASTHLTVVTPSNGARLTGTADAEATIVVTYADQNHTTQTAERSGEEWSVVPTDVELADGQKVTVEATDALGNVDTATIEIDTRSPDAPLVQTSTAETISGTAEKDSLVALTYQGADGTVTRTTTADENGEWAFTDLSPTPVLGSSASLTATDAAGNVSAATTVLIADPTSTASPSASADDTAAPTANTAGTTTASVATASGSVALTGTTIGDGTVLPGYDFVSNDGNATDDAGSSHGTRVAGVIAASYSGITKPIGVAPGTKIEPIRALGGTTVDVANAIAWGSGASTFFDSKGRPASSSLYPTNPYPADVLNLSLGVTSSYCPSYLQSAINAAVGQGTVVVVSAGNSNGPISAQAPANCQNVIVVTATTSAGKRAAYSNWGTASSPKAWLIAAPGGSGDNSDCNESAGWACTGFVVAPIASEAGKIAVDGTIGTSMAAPHVAGAAALLKSFDRTLTPAKIATLLRSSATVTPMSDSCPTGTCGSGIVNITAALSAAKTQANSGSGTVLTPPVNTYARTSVTVSWPKIVRVGSVLTATAANYELQYQWYRREPNGKKKRAISGATSRRYVVTAADYGKRLSVTVTGLGSATASSSTNKTTATGILHLTSRPTTRGTQIAGSTLTASAGSWSTKVKVRYQWLRNGKAIKRQTRSTYRLTAKDVGKRISVRVTATAKRYRQASATSTRTSPIKR